MNVALEATTDDFESLVIQRSQELPVLVDFWAPWCGPCRFLAPVLERLASELAGTIQLVKVNTDENPELSSRFGISGIPAVKLFKDGSVVDEFVGAIPEAQIRAFLKPHCPTEADRRVAEADRRLEAGDLAGARAELEAALESDPASTPAHLGLARLALAEGDVESVQRHADSVPMGTDEHEAAHNLVAAAQLVREARALGERDAIQERLQQAPGDVEAAFALGSLELAGGDLRAALQHYLDAARLDRRWRDEAPRRAMLVVFKILGVRHPTSDEFRDQLRKIYL